MKQEIRGLQLSTAVVFQLVNHDRPETAGTILILCLLVGTFLNEPVCSSVDSEVYCHSNQRGLKDRVFKNVFLLLEATFLHS